MMCLVECDFYLFVSTNLMAVIAALANIARRRPMFMSTIVQAFEALHGKDTVRVLPTHLFNYAFGDFLCLYALTGVLEHLYVLCSSLCPTLGVALCAIDLSPLGKY